MELIKKTLPVEEANGWYLMQTVYRYWNEEFIDDETGDQYVEERSESICGKGTLVNDIIKSLLIENGIDTIKVSNIPLLGNQEKSLNLWDASIKLLSGKNGSKKSYIVTADSPAAAEIFISEYLEVNLEATFKLIKISELDYQKVIKIYDSEREMLEQNKKRINWYKGQIYSMIDDGFDEGESSSAGAKNILVQATSFEKAIAAIKAVMHRNEYDSIYNTFKKLEELNIVDVFMPEDKLVYYSDADLSSIDDLEEE